jgi:hypothetical protein
MNRGPEKESTGSLQISAQPTQEQGNENKTPDEPKALTGETEHETHEEEEPGNLADEENLTQVMELGNEGQIGDDAANTDAYQHAEFKDDRDETLKATHDPHSNDGTIGTEMAMDMLTVTGNQPQENKVRSGNAPNSTSDEDITVQVTQTSNKRQKKQKVQRDLGPPRDRLRNYDRQRKTLKPTIQ